MPPTRMKTVFLVVRPADGAYISKTFGGRYRWKADRDKAKVFHYARSAAHVAWRYDGEVYQETRSQ
jgi:hypothetical protein